MVLIQGKHGRHQDQASEGFCSARQIQQDSGPERGKQGQGQLHQHRVAPAGSRLHKRRLSQGLDFPVRLIKQVFTNKDGSCGELFLVSSDRELSFDEITAISQKRWKVEDFYKSVKSNAAFAKLPASTVRTQGNHCFAAIYAFVKLEKLRIRTKLNHLVIKGKIYIEALKIAYDNLEKMSGTQNRLALV